MNYSNRLVAILTVMLAAPPTSARNSCETKIDRLADQVVQRVIEWRLDIHQNPELPSR